MGALPKNKITRAERGKRRAGNTPTITRDFRTASVPLHKRGLVNSILTAVGLKTGAIAEKTASKAAKAVAHKATVAGPQSPEAAKVAPVRAKSAPVRTAKRTQHKG